MRTVAFVVAKGKTAIEEWAVTVDREAVVALDAVPIEPDVVFTLTPDLAAALRDGSLDVNVGFMRGQIKMSGDNAALFHVLPALHGYHA